jgi:hypothetical protein
LEVGCCAELQVLKLIGFIYALLVEEEVLQVVLLVQRKICTALDERMRNMVMTVEIREEITDAATPAAESFEIKEIDAKSVRFAYDGENLTFTDEEGKFYPFVSLRRCFPLSATDTNVLVRVPDTDEIRGYEIGMTSNLEDLEPYSRDAVMRELKLYYFVPTIKKIEKIKDEFGFLYWKVQTDRGSKEFIIRDNITSSTRKVSDGRWLIIDINQTRYEVRNYEQLDPTSQKLLSRYLLL